MAARDQVVHGAHLRRSGPEGTAREALDAYGFDVLLDVATEGSALLCESVDAAGRALRERRTQLDLPIRTIASETGLAPARFPSSSWPRGGPPSGSTT